MERHNNIASPRKHRKTANRAIRGSASSGRASGGSTNRVNAITQTDVVGRFVDPPYGLRTPHPAMERHNNIASPRKHRKTANRAIRGSASSGRASGGSTNRVNAITQTNVVGRFVDPPYGLIGSLA